MWFIKFIKTVGHCDSDEHGQEFIITEMSPEYYFLDQLYDRSILRIPESGEVDGRDHDHPWSNINRLTMSDRVLNLKNHFILTPLVW